MKMLLYCCTLLLLLTSCTTSRCYPSKHSRDYAVSDIKTLYQVTYTYRWGARREFTTLTYECLPEGLKVGDTIQLKREGK
jgi:hypothetical protein